MEKVIEMMKNAVEFEYKRCVEEHGMFNSTHEGYAVIKEEFEEALDELIKAKDELNKIWIAVKTDGDFIPNAEEFYRRAILVASESIQMSTMALKMVESFKVNIVMQEKKDINPNIKFLSDNMNKRVKISFISKKHNGTFYAIGNVLDVNPSYIRIDLEGTDYPDKMFDCINTSRVIRAEIV